MELFGQRNNPLVVADYKQMQLPGRYWESLAQQKVSTGKGLEALGAGIESAGKGIGGGITKAENEAESSGEQEITFGRDDQGSLTPLSAGSGSFLFGAKGPSTAAGGGDFFSNLFGGVAPPEGSAEAMGASGAASGANIQSMGHALTVSTIQAANTTIADDLLQARQKFQGNPQAFQEYYVGKANAARDNIGGKQGLALYNAYYHIGGQHFANMVGDQFENQRNQSWDQINAGIKQSSDDAFSVARNFTGSFDQFKKTTAYKKVTEGYKSLEINPIFNGKMTAGKASQHLMELDNDLMKSHAIGQAERLRDEPGGSVDKAQAWLIKEYKNKGKDEIFNVANSHILWKSEAQKDEIEAVNQQVHTFNNAYATHTGVPDYAQVQSAIQHAQSMGAFSAAHQLRAGWEAYNDRKNYRGGVQGTTSRMAAATITTPGYTAPATALPDLDANFNEANDKLKMNAQEQFLYGLHRRNAVGSGGVDNPDGSRSSLKQMSVNIGGKVYNLPTVWNGKALDPKKPAEMAEIKKNVEALGLDNFPSYKTEAEAEKRYNDMHKYIDKDMQAIQQWKTANNRSHKDLQDHGWDASQFDKNVHLFGSRGTGYGGINMAWKGDLNGIGKGGISPNQLFTYFKGIGASDNEARMLTGAAASESGLNPNAAHDPVNGVYTGHGMWGHKHERIDMRGMNWQQQASAVLQELRSRPEGKLVNSATTPEELARAQMFFERPKGFTENHPEGGHNYTGRLNTIRRFYGLNGGAELPQVAAPGDIRTGPMPPTQEQIGANPYLATAYSRQAQADAHRDIAYASSQMPVMEAAIRQGVDPGTLPLARMQQMADQYPEQLGEKWKGVQQTMEAHPAAMELAGMGDAQQRIDDIRNVARSNGDLDTMAFADELEKQHAGMIKDYTDNPQRFGARKDVGYLPEQPPPLSDVMKAQDPQDAFNKTMDMKRKAGITLNNKFGNGVVTNTLMKDDVSFITNAMAADGNTASGVLKMVAHMNDDELAHLQKDDKFKGAIVGMTMSDDIQKVSAAMGFLDLQWSKNPVKFNQDYPSMRSQIAKWQSDLQFKSEKSAMENRRMALDPGQQAMRETMKSMAKTELDAMKPDQAFAAVGSFKKLDQALENGSTWGAKGVAWEEFKDLYTEYRQANNDTRAATAYAQRDIQMKWNNSELNGGRFMAYPPEMNGHYAPINGSTDWVKRQLAEDVSSLAEQNGLKKVQWNPRNGVFEDGVETALASDTDTQKDIANGVAPSYRILVKQSDGWHVMTTKDANGNYQPARFHADRQKAVAEANAEFMAKRSMSALYNGSM